LPKPEKVEAVAEIKRDFESADAFILVDTRGLSVSEVTELRTRLREAGAQLKVVKNTLAKIAAAEAGVNGLESLLEGPTAITICREDPATPAKVIQTYIREKRKLVVKGGYLQQRVLVAGDVDALATLPSRDELVAKLVGGLAAPLYGLATVLTGPLRGLAVALDQIREQKAQEA
jgi:large subunit ribosomal protein L10